jgi:hypothetical protein
MACHDISPPAMVDEFLDVTPDFWTFFQPAGP